jgi:hypothetical protein
MNQIWEFKLLCGYDNEIEGAAKWQVFANGKLSWETTVEDDEDFPETAPEAMARYFELWDTDKVTI